MTALRTLLAIAVALVALTACENHDGEHCVDSYTTTTYVKSGNVYIPVTSTHCSRWEADA